MRVASWKTRLSPVNPSMTGFLPDFDSASGASVRGARHGVRDVRLVDLGCDDRDPLGDGGRQPLRVIEMMVRNHAEADRLVRNDLLRLRAMIASARASFCGPGSKRTM